MESDEFIREWASNRGIPALVAGIDSGTADKDDDSSKQQFYDYAASRNDYTGQRFGVASLTKSFTALSILLLDNRGALALDEPVASYLDWEEKTETPVTIRHLLSHTSGRPSDFSHTRLLRQDMGADDGSYEIETFEDILALANDYPRELCEEPGTTYCYYNTGYALLGAIIEEVTDSDYESFVREHILDPLDMDSQFITEAIEPTPPFYRSTDSGLIPVTPDAPRVINPAAGLFCTCDDLLRYGRMLRDHGEYDGEQVLPKHVVEVLAEPVAAVEESDSLTYAGRPVGVATGDTEYALGVERKTINGVTVIGHHGNLGYSEAQLTIAEDTVIASVANRVTDDGGLQNLNLCLYDIANGQSIQEPYYATTNRLDELTGTYEAPQFDYNVVVERSGGYLRYETDYGANGTLIPDSVEDGVYYFTEAYDDGGEQRHRFVESSGGVHLYLERHAFVKVGE